MLFALDNNHSYIVMELSKLLNENSIEAKLTAKWLLFVSNFNMQGNDGKLNMAIN